MQYRRLGNSGIRVSTISLGSWLTFGHKMDEKVAAKCVHRAFDLGLNLFDTANVYASGRGEEVLGRALKPLPRHEYVLATKAYFPVGPGPNDRGLSRKHIFEQVQMSLRRLGTDYVDLFQCHRYDDETPLDETLRAIDDLIAQGKVLYGGVSLWSAENIADAVKLGRELGLRQLVSNQPQYHIFQREIETNGVLEVCAREGLGLIVYSPLARGLLSGKYTSVDDVPSDSRAADAVGREFMGPWFTEEGLERVCALEGVADEAGITLPELALAWCLRRPEVSSAIVGATKVEHVEANAAAAGVELSADVVAAIDRITEG
ncbi:MAG: aldo/keto reductase family protein [Gemmatimonadota bacterium]|nr:MAG: aldo/keto reductase family protein [Gemmatimonadota bacterium]